MAFNARFQRPSQVLLDGMLSVILLMCGPVFAVPSSVVVSFDNFREKVVLEQLDNNLFQLANTQLQIQLAPRLIVKIARNTAPSKLQHGLTARAQISELFLMRQEQYLLLTFTDIEQALAALTQLQRDPLVLLVQPDVQQKKLQAHSNIVAQPELTKSALPDYIQWAKTRLHWHAQAGKGVTVAMIDDGYDFSHPEFGHIKLALHYDFNQKKLVERQSGQSLRQHGTKVAGVLFAGHNGVAPEGIVPAATVVAIAQPDTWTSHTLQSFYLAYLAGADVINCSWHSRWLLQPLVDVVNELVIAGRKGKGTAIVFAAGNEGKQLTAGMHEAAIENVMTVGANDSNGQPLLSSNFGAMVDFWVYGGDSMTTANSGLYLRFSGTSLSAAIVSGYLALLLSHNPELQLKQAQQQLANMLEIE